MYENTNSSADFSVWRDELQDGSVCPTCLEIHPVHASCALSPLPDAVSVPPRLTKSGTTGALSLHDYRKYLSQECIDDPVDRSEKGLKRKPATLNLNQSPLSARPSCAISVSSASTPPLSPSYSHSIISQWSEQGLESIDPPSSSLSLLTVIRQKQSTDPVAVRSQSSRDHLVSGHLVRPRPNRKRLVSGLKH